MIPRTIHFIWIRIDDTPIDSNLFCIQTAVLNTTCKIVLHTNDERITSIPGVEIRKRDIPTVINKHPVNYQDVIQSGSLFHANGKKKELNCNGKRVSHVKDIIRLEILYEEGGIYSDLDVIWLRNPWELWDNQVVMAFTNQGYKVLCNAIIMAVPQHPAILQYKDYCISLFPCKKYWIPANPYKLWKDRKDITMIKKKVFFPMGWNQSSDEDYYKSLEEKDVTSSVAIHLAKSMNPNRATFGTIYDILKKDMERIPSTSQKQEV
jgi:hypothetical protein